MVDLPDPPEFRLIAFDGTVETQRAEVEDGYILRMLQNVGTYEIGEQWRVIAEHHVRVPTTIAFDDLVQKLATAIVNAPVDLGAVSVALPPCQACDMDNQPGAFVHTCGEVPPRA